MSDYVPPELLIEILQRLPVKSLLRFTSVCKSWYFLITSPSFINTHLNQTIATHKRNNPTLLLRYYDSDKWLMEQKEHYYLHFDDETLGHKYLELEFPFRTQLGYFRIVGSCNGLICLSDDLFSYEQTIILWNPSIRQSVIPPIRSKPNWPSLVVLGFGVDPLTYEHKVVRILYYKESLRSYVLPPKVEIYTIGTGLWRSIDNAIVPPYCMVEFMWTQAFFNGYVHWIAYDQHVVDRFHSLIVSFDMGGEVFGKILLPDALAGQISANLSVTVIERSLAVCVHDERVESLSCCIWVMKEYGVVGSWTKLVNVDFLGEPERIVGYRKNGEVLLSVRDNFLASYDPKTQLRKNLGIRGTSRSFYVDTYMETLFLLKGQNRILDGRMW